MTKAYDLIYIPLGTAGFYGAEHSLLELAEGMSKLEKNVLIISEKALEKTKFPILAAEHGLDIEWVGWSPDKNALHNIISAIFTFRKFQAKIIHFNISWRPRVWLVALVARLISGAKLIGSMRGMPDPHWLVPRRRHLGFIPGMRLWHLHEVIVGKIWALILDLTVSVNAQDIPKGLIANFGFRPNKIRVIYNGVHFRSNLLPDSERRKIRDRFNLKEGDILVCFVGRLSEDKGVNYLLRAISKLPIKFKLIILGDGALRILLESLSHELRIERRVHFLGFVDDPDNLMAASDVVVVPSPTPDPCPRVVIDAMNQGTPVIASRIGGMAEIFSDQVEGIFVEPKNVGELTKALEILGRDPNKLHYMGIAGRRRVEKDYSIERVIKQYLDLYEELLK
jgi:glycosyltransferase involved in cell wall biosynthesis